MDPGIEMGDLTTARGKVHGLLGADAGEHEGDGDKICRISHRGLNAVGAGKPMELACMCVQADSSLSVVRGEVVQVSRNRICQICGDTVQNVGKGLETG